MLRCFMSTEEWTAESYRITGITDWLAWKGISGGHAVLGHVSFLSLLVHFVFVVFSFLCVCHSWFISVKSCRVPVLIDL